MYISIGGIEQWIQIEGEGPANPVLLFLHGGPGGTSIPAAVAWKSWRRHFTVVHWDQRGAGQTFQRNGESGCGPLSLERIVEDGLEVAQHLRTELKKEKILLVGHSWGAVVGIHMIKRRSDLFSAFVGASVLVNFKKSEAFTYRRALALAQKNQDAEALKALTELAPPYNDRTSFLAFRRWVDRLAAPLGDGVRPHPIPANPEINPAIVEAITRGAEFSRAQLFPIYRQIDLVLLGTTFDVPIFFFLGTEDHVTSFELASQYFDSLSAPYKALVPFEGLQHFFVMNRPDDFLQQLTEKVRPFI